MKNSKQNQTMKSGSMSPHFALIFATILGSFAALVLIATGHKKTPADVAKAPSEVEAKTEIRKKVDAFLSGTPILTGECPWYRADATTTSTILRSYCLKGIITEKELNQLSRYKMMVVIADPPATTTTSH